MTVNLSALAGAGVQFFDNSGNPLSGGKLWSYQAGTTTPQTTYTTAAGNVAHTNPIVLNSAGRVSTGEIWLTVGSNYKFVLMTSADVTLATWDNITGINGTGIASNASNVTYDPAGTGAVATTVQTKLRETVSVKDFGAVGDGVTDDTAAVVAALQALQNNQILDLVGGTYALFVGNNGVPSGDALPLADVPHLSGRNNIKIRNGTLFAANPGVSPSKVRYPTTLSFIDCTNMTLENVTLRSRGESYGNSDAGVGLGSLGRAIFSIQNGGHAFLFTRSKGLTAVNCNFELCGSTGACYLQSSDESVFSDCYATAQSLGYNAFACDGWAGSAASLGYTQFETILNNCRSDNNGATYGSKGCVLGEDGDVIIQVNGGVWKDAYANGSARFIGQAFGATSCKVYVRGAYVENCAAIGATGNTTGAATALECIGVKARGLRTSMHIQNQTTFGTVTVRYEACDAEITGNQVWPADPELSVKTVIANMKVASGLSVKIIGCRTSGAHTFEVNTAACYGGISVIGGEHTVTDRIFDSAGWGSAGAGSFDGYSLLNTKFNVLLENTAVVSTAITQATTAINAITNRDPNLVLTYQFIDFDAATQVNSNLFRSFANILLLGSGLGERRFLAQALNNCFQGNSAGVPRTTSVKVISRDGISGSNVQVTFALLDNRVPSGGKIVGDDVYAVRGLLSAYSAATAVGAELHQGWFVNNTTYNLTIGDIYNVVTRG